VHNMPFQVTPESVYAANEIEFGVGTHGEPGIAREKIKDSSRGYAGTSRNDFPYNSVDKVALLVNGLGATPLMELYLLNNSINDIIDKKGIRIYKTFIGNYMTSIDMAGASISFPRPDNQLKNLLDAPTNTIALKI
jgi:dihydroxyacetone kinase